MNNTDDRPPPEIQKAAAQVQAWLDSRKPTASQPRSETAAERFTRMPRSDTPPAMPPPKEMRPEFVRWKKSAPALKTERIKQMAGNENRAHVEKSGVENRMTPTTAEPRVSPGDMPPGILGAPMTLDPHSQGRHSFDNLERKPGEVARSKRTAETRRRIEDRTPTYKY